MNTTTRWKKIVSTVSIAGLLAGVLAGCGGQQAVVEETVQLGTPVEIEVVQPQDFDKVVTLGGITAAKSTVNVIAKVNGMEQIAAVNVKVGDKVSAGQVLAQIDSTTMQITVSNAQMAYDDALRNYENNQALFELGALSQQNMNQLEMALKNAENNLRSAKLGLGYLTVTAPISGTVTMVNAEVGSYATASAPMFEIANVDTLKISAGINEKNVSKIAIGQEVLVKINSASEEWMTGTITEISKVMNMNTKNYPITIALNNQDNELVAGMYAEIKVVVDHVDDRLVIPVQAIVYKDAQPVVYTVQEDGTVKECAVELGLNDGDHYVIESGLTAGDKMVVKGNSKLVNGEAVTVYNAEPENSQAAEETEVPEANAELTEDSPEEDAAPAEAE